MKIHRKIVALLFVAIGTPLYSGAQLPREVDPLLKRASSALDQYQRLEPDFRCQDVQKPEFRIACVAATQTLAERVAEAKNEIALFRQRPNPQPGDLFDAYEKFGRVLAILEDVNYVDPDSYGEHNKRLFAEAYNSFVKLNAWFGGVVKASMQGSTKCPGSSHDGSGHASQAQ